MYPAHALSLFPPFPHEPRVFVAMSFDPRLQPRWERVIAPGIRDAFGLDAFRVDIPRTGGSIPVEIIRGIAHSKLLFADVTSLDGHRNGNVMYEVGIAHACRLPEEVLLFRSDNDRLLFDVSTIRVNLYDPDGRPDEARVLVKDAVVGAIRELGIVTSTVVRNALAALDPVAIEMLIACAGDGGGKHPEIRTMGDAVSTAPYLRATGRLLELGLIRTHFEKMTRELIEANAAKIGDFLRASTSYRVTPFGHAVLKALIESWGVRDYRIPGPGKD